MMEINSIKDKIVLNLICRFLDHKTVEAGSCPFTGATYDYCSRCSHMIPREYVD